MIENYMGRHIDQFYFAPFCIMKITYHNGIWISKRFQKFNLKLGWRVFWRHDCWSFPFKTVTHCVRMHFYFGIYIINCNLFKWPPPPHRLFKYVSSIMILDKMTVMQSNIADWIGFWINPKFRFWAQRLAQRPKQRRHKAFSKKTAKDMAS